MKITAIAALCAAPLALAGTLDMDLRSRGNLGARDGVLVASEVSQTQEQTNSKNNNNNQKNNNNGNGNGNSQGNNNNQISSITSTSSTEVIIIWVNPGNNAATTTVNSAAAVSTAAVAAAATHTVVVGGATKVYTPDTINAAVGDMVVFQFAEQNHTATQSAFTAPCVSIGGFDSGFQPNINGSINPPPSMGMLVNVSTPLWFYCRQTGHCGAGMTFSINPTANKTQADFQNLAIQQNGTGTASPITATSSVAVAPPPASSVAPPPAASSSSTGLTTGTGTVGADGSCTCAVVCAAGSIPNVASQGVNAFGGMGGSIPASAMEITGNTVAGA